MELNMMKNKKVVDVSSFFLFEATGDSESGFHFDPAIDVNNGNEEEDHEDNDDDDDDAESCSCDYYTSGFFLPSPVRNRVNGLEKIRANFVVDDEDYEEDGEVVEQQKEVHLFEKWRNNNHNNGVGGAGKSQQKNMKSAVNSVDSSSKTMNEMEKSRLFWETCLAS